MSDSKLGAELQKISSDINKELNEISTLKNLKWDWECKKKYNGSNCDSGFYSWVAQIGKLFTGQATIKSESQSRNYFVPRDEKLEEKYLELLDLCIEYHKSKLTDLKFNLQLMTDSNVEYNPGDNNG